MNYDLGFMVVKKVGLNEAMTALLGTDAASMTY